MQLDEIKSLYLKHKEPSLFHRYITNNHIEPLLNNFNEFLNIEIIGKSVLNAPIYGLNLGNGEKRILMWSQMHGNESTTTKALFDLFNTLSSKHEALNILDNCSLYVIPILNPDGAQAYTRVNGNEIDLNRDAQDLSQPESKVLRKAFETFKPHYCFNLHGQRTIFSAGSFNKPATVSFLAPAQDKACTVTANRKVAMEVIGAMNNALQEVIPNQVGVYDDAFNLNCVGDTFQSENVPTILFEAGHFKNDYARDITREFIYTSYLIALNYISNNTIIGDNFNSYFKIPENEKLFYDVIIRNAKIENSLLDIGFLFQEKLVDGHIEFVPKIEKIEKLDAFFGHREIDANGTSVLSFDGQKLKVDYENVFVMINNEKISLFSK
ncbi:M14 family metallopeptidase [Sabulilitoribacter multivorans]|uniref:M14 family metallopeptidase n=1 Tax=Flaviramulus multivorans TaxID=1304750 RepID=A0ABS9IJP9_9FLAO|nr:M14 metallopeptidase family protein [Flaviramulus multivorans]MCF7560814.1 M14 family metallopeptidase [Flaviramulus multivorans]